MLVRSTKMPSNFIFLDLVGIDREVLIADRLQVAPKAGVADQRLVALGELPLQRGHDRRAIGAGRAIDGTNRRDCAAVVVMAGAPDHLPEDTAALKAALSETRAKLSGAEALIEHLQLVIAKMKRAMFGPRSERSQRLID